jgi:hypothetical protein
MWPKIFLELLIISFIFLILKKILKIRRKRFRYMLFLIIFNTKLQKNRIHFLEKPLLLRFGDALMSFFICEILNLIFIKILPESMKTDENVFLFELAECFSIADKL